MQTFNDVEPIVRVMDQSPYKSCNKKQQIKILCNKNHNKASDYDYFLLLSITATVYQCSLLSFVFRKETITMNEPDLLAKLGERIRETRIRKKMSQNDLAIECNFEKASMSRIESGQTNPTVKTLFKICEALDITMADLFKD